MIVAIDGPAGAGKSTIAKRLARELGFLYIDTGAMYRALTLKAVRGHITLEDTAALVAMARQTRITLEPCGDRTLVFLDGEDVSAQIRTPELTQAVFYLARQPQIREIMVGWQQLYAQKKDIVMEGRDIGTVVFPHAPVKFYLDATAAERADRRHRELKERGIARLLADVRQEIEERDQHDRTRECGPLRQAADAIYIDSTSLAIDAVVTRMQEHIRHVQTH